MRRDEKRLDEMMRIADCGIQFLRRSVQRSLDEAVTERARFDAAGSFAEFVACEGEAPKRLVNSWMQNERDESPAPARSQEKKAPEPADRSRRLELRRADANRVRLHLARLRAEAEDIHESVVKLKTEQVQRMRSAAAASRLAQRLQSSATDDLNSESSSTSILAGGAPPGRAPRSCVPLTDSQEEGRARIAKEFPRAPVLPPSRMHFKHLAKIAASLSMKGGATQRLSEETDAMRARQARDAEERRRLKEASTLRVFARSSTRVSGTCPVQAAAVRPESLTSRVRYFAHE
jgi:hypothetical protein